jgi:hypothetical protein
MRAHCYEGVAQDGMCAVMLQLILWKSTGVRGKVAGWSRMLSIWSLLMISFVLPSLPG